MTFMLILGGLAALWLARFLFRMSALALPLYAGLGAGFAALDREAGYPAAVAIGGGAALTVLLAGRMLAASASPLVCGIVTAGFAVPAGFAGYQAARALMEAMVIPGAAPSAVAILAAALAADAARRLLANRAPGKRGDEPGAPPP